MPDALRPSRRLPLPWAFREPVGHVRAAVNGPLAPGEERVGPQIRQRDPGAAVAPAKSPVHREALAPGRPGDREIDVAGRLQRPVPRVATLERAAGENDPPGPVTVRAGDAVGQALGRRGPAGIPRFLRQHQFRPVERQGIDLDSAGEQRGEAELKRQVSARGQHRPGGIALGQADILEHDPGEGEQHDLRAPPRRQRHAPALLQTPADEAGGAGSLDRPRQAGSHQPRSDESECEGGKGAAQRHCTPWAGDADRFGRTASAWRAVRSDSLAVSRSPVPRTGSDRPAMQWMGRAGLR
ncbi:hypothetical protein M2440_003853 [Methylorubrum extorquens]|nr:hypothetical protein [Methylorubrum extorquens]